MGGGNVVGVAGGAIAAQFAVNLRPPGLGVLVLLQHQGCSPFADDEAAPTGVKRQGGGIGILRHGQGLHVDEARNAHRNNGCFRTAGNHRIGVAVTDYPQGLTDGIGAGGTGGHRRQGRTLAVVADGNHARRHIGDHHGYAQGGHPVRSPALQLADLRGHGVQATDAGAKVHRHPLRRQSADNAALLHRLNGSAHGILGKLITAQGLAAVHVLHGVKALDLGSQLGLVVGCIKISDGTDAVVAGNQVVPGGFHVAAHRADHAQTGYHHTSVFCHFTSLLTWRCRRLPGGLRRLHTLPWPDRPQPGPHPLLRPWCPGGSWQAGDYFPECLSYPCG